MRSKPRSRQQVAQLGGALASRVSKGRYAGLTDDDAIALAVKEDDARVRAYARRARKRSASRLSTKRS